MKKDAQRNRSKEFRELCALNGTHRITVYDGNGTITNVFECVDYEPIYSRVLIKFQSAADALIHGSPSRQSFPATWRHSFVPGSK